MAAWPSCFRHYNTRVFHEAEKVREPRTQKGRRGREGGKEKLGREEGAGGESKGPGS